MTCRAAFAALRSLLVGSATPVSGPASLPTKNDTYGHAASACPWLRPDGSTQPDLTLRAHRLNNRSPKAAAVYLRKHLILSKGI